VRRVAAVLICLILLLAVGIAYNQCVQQQCSKENCPSPCPGNCPTGGCPQASTCPSASASCPMGTACATCDGSDGCPLKGTDKVSTAAGTVRSVRARNGTVKLATGPNQSLLLRVNPACKLADATKQKLSALKKGDAVTAQFWTCPKSGKHYLVDLSTSASADASIITSPSAGACGGSCGGGCGSQ